MTSIAAIRALVADKFGVEPALLQSGSTGRTVVEARYAGIYLARAHTDASLEAIGRSFGRRGHVNTLDALARANLKRKSDGVFRYRLGLLSRALADRGSAAEPVDAYRAPRPTSRRPLREPVAALMAADDALKLARGTASKAAARRAFDAALKQLRAVFENAPEAKP